MCCYLCCVSSRTHPLSLAEVVPVSCLINVQPNTVTRLCRPPLPLQRPSPPHQTNSRPARTRAVCSVRSLPWATSSVTTQRMQIEIFRLFDRFFEAVWRSRCRYGCVRSNKQLPALTAVGSSANTCQFLHGGVFGSMDTPAVITRPVVLTSSFTPGRTMA